MVSSRGTLIAVALCGACYHPCTEGSARRLLRTMFRIHTIAAAAILGSIAGAQHSWRPLPGTQPAGRQTHVVAYDEARGRLVLFGGRTPQAGIAQNDTWEWDGTRWHAMASPRSPTQRYFAAMAYDPSRGRTVLFGGIQNNTLEADTWEWDGTRWTEVEVPGPQPRSGATMVYDSARERLVLFGGNRSFGSFLPTADVWEFDGAAWVPRRFSSGPPPMSGHVAAYDDHRQRMVVYSHSHHQTWEWDGDVWTLADPAPALPARNSATLAYDRTRRRCVLYGGATSVLSILPPLQDTWEWDGVGWTEVATPVSAGPRSGGGSVFDSSRGEVLVVGGRARQFSELTSAVAAFDGRSWSTLSPPHGFVNTESEVAWDGNTGRPIAFGGRVGFFGGSQETYTFDGRQWVLMPVSEKPAPRYRHTLQWDRARGEVVMFGGTISGLTDETWVWDGDDWQQRHPTDSPSPRNLPLMTYDERRRRVVLYGGGGSVFAPPFGDTWVWNGENWREIVTSVSPPPLQSSALAYDSRRDRCVLFGGGTGAAGLEILGETWEFDGRDWVQIVPEHSPSPRDEHTMVYDPVRERVVLFGGEFLGVNTDTWEWDGTDWVEVPHARPPYFVRMVFHERQARMLGFADGSESWEYRSDHPPAVAELGTPCGLASLSVPPLRYPVVGRRLTLGVDPVRPFWPVLYQLTRPETDPIRLDALGLPGCTLLQGTGLWIPDFAGPQGRSTLHLPAIDRPWMLGLSFHVQAIARDPRTSPHGWVTTQGLALRYGR